MTEASVDDRRVIDISAYLESPSPEQGRAFAVWGGEGNRARLALPVWRAIYLLAGDRGGILWHSSLDDAELRPFFVLDLGEDPARTAFPGVHVTQFRGQEAPGVASTREGGVVVFLGEEEGKLWFLVVRGSEACRKAEGRAKDELLFLAGECAGLLFFRELAKEAK